MLLFGLLALALSLVALFVVLRPMWPRARMFAVVMAVSCAVIAVGLYRLLGTPLALDPAMVRTPTTIAEAVAQLEARLKTEAANADALRLLAQAYASEGRSADAANALAKAVAAEPDNPDLLVEAAAARALNAPEHRFDSQGVAWLDRALQKNLAHQRALWFKGIAQRQAGQNADAAQTWQRLLPMVDAKTAGELSPQIDEALKAAGLPALPASATANAAKSGLDVRVALIPGFDTKDLDPATTVFVVARALGGPPMPVAVEKHRLDELPLQLTLDDSDSPMPTAKLSALKSVEVFARISRSGAPTRSDDDIETTPVRIELPHPVPVDLRFDGATK